jgi:hypothetical protein
MTSLRNKCRTGLVSYADGAVLQDDQKYKWFSDVVQALSPKADLHSYDAVRCALSYMQCGNSLCVCVFSGCGFSLEARS